VVSLGNNVLESPCAVGGSLVGRVSVADASLSLSLSLWSGWRLAARPFRRGIASRLAGLRVRFGFSRAVGALSVCCRLAVMDCWSVAAVSCLGSGGCGCGWSSCWRGPVPCVFEGGMGR